MKLLPQRRRRRTKGALDRPKCADAAGTHFSSAQRDGTPPIDTNAGGLSVGGPAAAASSTPSITTDLISPPAPIPAPSTLSGLIAPTARQSAAATPTAATYHCDMHPDLLLEYIGV